jgi:uncharacterized protein YbjQ (UPF0145 family)
MIITTSNEILGSNISTYLGVVHGIAVVALGVGNRARGKAGEDLGGNVAAYTETCDKGFKEAMNSMTNSARERGADAIIAMRFSTSEFVPGAMQVVAYGTAVKFKTSP